MERWEKKGKGNDLAISVPSTPAHVSRHLFAHKGEPWGTASSGLPNLSKCREGGLRKETGEQRRKKRICSQPSQHQGAQPFATYIAQRVFNWMKILVPSAPMISKQKWGVNWRCAEDRREGERWLRKYFSWISTPHFFFLNGLPKEECVTQHSIQYASLRSCLKLLSGEQIFYQNWKAS